MPLPLFLRSWCHSQILPLAYVVKVYLQNMIRLRHHTLFPGTTSPSGNTIQMHSVWTGLSEVDLLNLRSSCFKVLFIVMATPSSWHLSLHKFDFCICKLASSTGFLQLPQLWDQFHQVLVQATHDLVLTSEFGSWLWGHVINPLAHLRQIATRWSLVVWALCLNRCVAKVTLTDSKSHLFSLGSLFFVKVWPSCLNLPSWHTFCNSKSYQLQRHWSPHAQWHFGKRPETKQNAGIVAANTTKEITSLWIFLCKCSCVGVNAHATLWIKSKFSLFLHHKMTELIEAINLYFRCSRTGIMDKL